MPTHHHSSSASSQQSQYEIPRELQEVLLDFTVHYLIEQPGDLITFALEYFNKLDTSRNGAISGPPSRGIPQVNVIPSSGRGGAGNSHENHSEDDESMLSDEDLPSNFFSLSSPYLHT